MWVCLHCESVVFPDHTACTDPGNIVGGGGPGRSATGFFSPQLNFSEVQCVLLKENIISKAPTFFRGVGSEGSNFSLGRGPIAYSL